MQKSKKMGKEWWMPRDENDWVIWMKAMYKLLNGWIFILYLPSFCTSIQPSAGASSPDISAVFSREAWPTSTTSSSTAKNLSKTPPLSLIVSRPTWFPTMERMYSQRLVVITVVGDKLNLLINNVLRHVTLMTLMKLMTLMTLIYPFFINCIF